MLFGGEAGQRVAVAMYKAESSGLRVYDVASRAGLGGMESLVEMALRGSRPRGTISSLAVMLS